MRKQFLASGMRSGFQYDGNNYGLNQTKRTTNEGSNKSMNRSKVDDDLVIEENTVYEIDRECYDRISKQRKRKNQERRSI